MALPLGFRPSGLPFGFAVGRLPWGLRPESILSRAILSCQQIFWGGLPWEESRICDRRDRIRGGETPEPLPLPVWTLGGSRFGSVPLVESYHRTFPTVKPLCRGFFGWLVRWSRWACAPVSQVNQKADRNPILILGDFGLSLTVLRFGVIGIGMAESLVEEGVEGDFKMR